MNYTGVDCCRFKSVGIAWAFILTVFRNVCCSDTVCSELSFVLITVSTEDIAVAAAVGCIASNFLFLSVVFVVTGGLLELHGGSGGGKRQVPITISRCGVVCKTCATFK